MILENSWTVSTVVATGTLLVALYLYLTSTYDYWKKRGVPYVKPELFFGNIKDQLLLRKPLFVTLNDIYKELKGKRFGGFYEIRTPVLMLRDPELIKRVLLNDFSHFKNREPSSSKIYFKENPLFHNLNYASGRMWRILRRTLTPLYSTVKVKGMMEQIYKGSDEMIEEIEKHADSGKAVDTRVLLSSFSLNLSASISFGLQYDPQSPEGIRFRQAIRSLIPPPLLQRIKIFFVTFFSSLAKFLKVKFVSKELADYFVDLIRTTMDHRKKNNIQRNDFLQLVIKLKEDEESGKQVNWKSGLTDEDAYLTQTEFSLEDGNVVFSDEFITVQALAFVGGGAEVMSTGIQFALYELAYNTHVQERLQQDIYAVFAKHNGEFTYQSLMEMNYLDLFIHERNRKYSGFLKRTCVIPYQIPGTDIVISKDTSIYVPLFAIHRDPEYYPYPERFIPERFEGSNYPSKWTYLPFGDGPRMCVAMRLANLTMKATIAKIVSRYHVTLNSRTLVPVEFDPTSQINFKFKGGVWVHFKKRQL